MTKLLQFLKSPEFTFGVHAFYPISAKDNYTNSQHHENTRIIQVLY